MNINRNNPTATALAGNLILLKSSATESESSKFQSEDVKLIKGLIFEKGKK